MASDEESTERLRRAMAALGEPHRFRLALLLGERPHAVGELVRATGLPQPLVSHHLSILSRAGLAEFQRSGRHAYYRLGDPEHPGLRALVSLMRPAGYRLEDPEFVRAGLPDRESGSRDADDRSLVEEPDRPAPPRLGEIEDYLL